MDVQCRDDEQPPTAIRSSCVCERACGIRRGWPSCGGLSFAVDRAAQRLAMRSRATDTLRRSPQNSAYFPKTGLPGPDFKPVSASKHARNRLRFRRGIRTGCISGAFERRCNARRYVRSHKPSTRLCGRSPLNIGIAEPRFSERSSRGKSDTRREFKVFIDISPGAAIRFSVIGGPCGCHPP